MYLNFNLMCSMMKVKEQSREIFCHRKGRRVVLMRDGLVDPNDKVEDSFKVSSTHNLTIQVFRTHGSFVRIQSCKSS